MNRRPTDEEVAVLFHHIGKGVWHLQYVEDHLAVLLAMAIVSEDPGTRADQDIEDMLSKYRKGTLGSLLKKAREAGVLPSSLEGHLNGFTDERNWLIHRSIDSHGKRLYTEAGMTETFDRLERFIVDAIALRREISDEISRLAASQGLNVGAAKADARAEVEWLNGDAQPSP